MNEQLHYNSGIILKMIGEIITDTDFGRSVIGTTYPHYFTGEDYQRIIAIIKDYHSNYDNIPNIDNIELIARDKYKKEYEVTPIINILEKIKQYKLSIKKGINTDDSAFIQSNFSLFLRTQETKKLTENEIPKLIEEARKTQNISLFDKIPNLFDKVTNIGLKDKNVVNLFDDIDSALSEDYRNPTKTNIGLDEYMDGGLANGEIGFILAPMGVGKTTILSILGCEAMVQGRNVLHLYFEGKTSKEKKYRAVDIKRKYYARILNVPLSKIKNYTPEELKLRLVEFKEKNNLGKLHIEKFDDDGITIPFIKNLIRKYEKEFNVKYDMLILDYIDCVESHLRYSSMWESEAQVVNALERLTASLDIACWTATQGTKDSTEKPYLTMNDSGGSVQKGRKATIYVSFAKSPEQHKNKTANAMILKNRVGASGYKFDNILLDNDAMQIFFPSNNVEEFTITEKDFDYINNAFSKN